MWKLPLSFEKRRLRLPGLATECKVLSQGQVAILVVRRKCKRFPQHRLSFAKLFLTVEEFGQFSPVVVNRGFQFNDAPEDRLSLIELSCTCEDVTQSMQQFQIRWIGIHRASKDLLCLRPSCLHAIEG